MLFKKNRLHIIEKQLSPSKPVWFGQNQAVFSFFINCLMCEVNVFKSCSNPQKIQQVFEFVSFSEWSHKWSSFRSFWSGPVPKLLDRGISLKFLLETRLKYESFHTLDNLLGFQVQKSWPKNNIIIINPLLRWAWSNYDWPTGHFTKSWQLARHFQQNDVGCKATDSQGLKLKRDNMWVKGTLYQCDTCAVA